MALMFFCHEKTLQNCVRIESPTFCEYSRGLDAYTERLEVQFVLLSGSHA